MKFRVWNKAKEKYEDFNLYAIDEDGDLYRLDGIGECVDLSLADEDGDYFIEYFTGVTDANGKEIYEGDIVRVSPKFKPDITEIYNGEVVFAIGYGAFMIDFHDYDLNDVLLVPTVVDRRVAVIGNIHEDKEFLE